MTEPRRHYALPPQTGEMPETREDQLDLWELDCERCEGSGKIRIAADEGDPTIPIACPVCKGAGTIRFQSVARDFDWRE